MQYPAFVWKLHPFRDGHVVPEIWHRECHTGVMQAGGKQEVVPHASAHPITAEDEALMPGEGDAALFFRLLARLYPPPAGYKEWREGVEA